MSTFMFKYLNHDLRLLKFNKPLHFFAEMPLLYLPVLYRFVINTHGGISYTYKMCN